MCSNMRPLFSCMSGESNKQFEPAEEGEPKPSPCLVAVRLPRMNLHLSHVIETRAYNRKIQVEWF